MGDSDDSESDLNLAQQILDDLDILLPVAGDHHSDGRSSGDSSENVEAVKMSGASRLHPLYSLNPSLRLLTAARNGDLNQVWLYWPYRHNK